MDKSARAPGYDLFKLLVALLLLILFLLFLRKGTPQVPTVVDSVPSRTLRSTSTITTQTRLPQAGETSLLNLSATATQTPLPSLSPTVASTPSATSTSKPSESTSTPAAENASSIDPCRLAASHSRLQVGMNAMILRRLNFRSSPGIQNNWLLTNKPGTKVKIIGGPTCLPYFIGAYIWWQLKLPDGRIGWSAEASLLGKFYFIEPSH